MHTETAIITINQLSFSYPSANGSESILQNIQLSVRRGEWVGIVGTNGSGKSTLAKLMAKLLPAASGEVRLAVPEQPPIQLIFQNPDVQAVGETVLEDIRFGMENYGVAAAEMEQRAQHALQITGLAAYAHTPVAELSGGQKQLLAIAASMSMNPAVLIFDEATSMLDPLSRHSIGMAAQQLHRNGTTIVWITQWLDELAWGDRVVALDQGCIVFDGSPRDFYYAKDEQRRSCCDRLGFVPPYTVQAALSLLQHGLELDPLPLTADELGKAAGAL
jgi:energy-coupling factor transport system ATP-binding protein